MGRGVRELAGRISWVQSFGSSEAASRASSKCAKSWKCAKSCLKSNSDYLHTAQVRKIVWQAAKRSAHVKLRSTPRSRRTARRASGLGAYVLPIYFLYLSRARQTLPDPQIKFYGHSTRREKPSACRQNHQLVKRRSLTLFTKPNSINVASKFDPP